MFREYTNPCDTDLTLFCYGSCIKQILLSTSLVVPHGRHLEVPFFYSRHYPPECSNEVVCVMILNFIFDKYLDFIFSNSS